jgi:hypothetical protein
MVKEAFSGDKLDKGRNAAPLSLEHHVSDRIVTAV